MSDMAIDLFVLKLIGMYIFIYTFTIKEKLFLIFYEVDEILQLIGS